MASCIEKLPHDCGSSDGLQVFQDHNGGYNGWCFACSTYVEHPYGSSGPATKPVKAVKDTEAVAAEMVEISGLPTVPLPSRALRAETLSYFGVKVALSQADGLTPEVSYWPSTKDGNIVSYKAKLLAKKTMWSVGYPKESNEMFGWKQAIASGARTLFITEGEEDAAALYQAIRDNQVGTKWTHLIPACVSLPSGSSSVKSALTRQLSVIKATFKEVCFVFDMDEAGRLATKEAMQIIPHGETVQLPEKDANACVLAGKSMALATACLFRKAAPKNTRIISAASLREVAKVQAEYGLSWPWQGMTKLTRGIRTGETLYLGAGVKMGKSTIRSALASHFITNHKKKVFMASPEEANKKTYQLVLGQIAGKIFHDPDVPFDFKAFDDAADALGDNLQLLNIYQALSWDVLRDDIIAACNAGCELIVIDPITNITNGIGSGEANTVLQDVAQSLAQIALDHKVVVMMFCHLKAPDSGDPHERGGKVYSHQFAGSRAMMRSCNMMIGLEGNKDPDLPTEIRNQRRLVVLEDREFGASGVVPLYYSNESGLYAEMEGK